jgi:hypothetical protein
MKKPKLTMHNILGHWKTIRTHRKWVRHYCRIAGIPWRGIVHDLSKYSPTEFLESARYWTGTYSPIEKAKAEQGLSYAWLHHRGRNPHHWAYWADNFSEGLVVYPMPMNDFVEMVCDFLAAGRAYSRSHFSYTGERQWWLKEREGGCAGMNQINKDMLDVIFSDLEFAENHDLTGCPSSLITMGPEELIKTGYLQEIWRAFMWTKKN